jgi:RNA polymerase-associated protein RTF1
LQERKKVIDQKESDESESDFGDDDDEDSDDDYEDAGALKPWQKKAQEAKSAKTRTSSRLYEEEDESVEEEAEEVEKKEKRQDRVVKPAELEDYVMITLPRRRLGRWCNEPFFKEAVLNCFVKLFVGEDPNGKRCYRLCRIADVDTVKEPYSLPPVKKEKPVMTDKTLLLQFGANKKAFPLRLVSDAKPTQADVTQFETAMKTARLQDELLGKYEANKLRRKQDELISNFTYSAEDIERQLKERKQKGQSTANLGLEQTRAAIAVQAARDTLAEAKALLEAAADSNEVADAEMKINDAEKLLEQRLKEEQRVLDKVKTRKERLTSRTTDQKWAKVNERALKMNRQADVGAFKTKETVVDKNASGQPVFNPYARRKVKPKILWEVGQKDEKKEGDEVKDSEATKDATTQANGDKDVDSTPALVQEQQGKAAALSQSHQFTIDEETLAMSSFTSGIGGLSSKKNVAKRVRKGLSLAEYQERKAAGSL